jgi:hypothetical protein
MRFASIACGLTALAMTTTTWADVPKSLRGTWDVSQSACARAASATRVTVTRDRLDFRTGFADITQTELSQNTRRFVAFLRGALYEEGRAARAVETAFYRLEHLGGRDTLGVKRKDRARRDLVRCGTRVAAPEPAPTGGCGHYVVLAEKRDLEGAFALQDRLGISKVTVLDSDALKSFRKGRHLVLTGPFATRAGALADQATWTRRVPSAYVKQSC